MNRMRALPGPRSWAFLVATGYGLLVGYTHHGHAVAAIHGTALPSSIDGTAHVTQTPDGVTVVVHLTGAPAGLHGMHLHERGDCGDGGMAAGGHFNPDNHPHGNAVADGIAKAHAGDLGNITIGADGTGTLTVAVAGLTVDPGPHTVIDKAIILHEKADDFGQPTGNAGGRIACGVIQAQE